MENTMYKKDIQGILGCSSEHIDKITERMVESGMATYDPETEIVTLTELGQFSSYATMRNKKNKEEVLEIIDMTEEEFLEKEQEMETHLKKVVKRKSEEQN